MVRVGEDDTWCLCLALLGACSGMILQWCADRKTECADSKPLPSGRHVILSSQLAKAQIALLR
jgi:hypothetical protein